MIFSFLVASVLAAPFNFTFSKTLEISESTVVIDGKKSTQFKCPHVDRKTKNLHYADIKSGNTVIPLHCLNNYMGGIYFKDTKPKVADSDGDAGDFWGNTSLFFRAKNGKLIWINYSRHETALDFECDMTTAPKKRQECIKKFGGKMKCQNSQSYREWDPKTKEFVATSFKGPFPEFTLVTKKKNCIK